MTRYPRSIQPTIEQALYKGKIIVIFGARQEGKTTLIRALQEKYTSNTLYLNCDGRTGGANEAGAGGAMREAKPSARRLGRCHKRRKATVE